MINQLAHFMLGRGRVRPCWRRGDYATFSHGIMGDNYTSTEGTMGDNHTLPEGVMILMQRKGPVMQPKGCR